MSKQSSNLLFELTDFRPYVRGWALARGRGEYRKICLALGMHTTLMSQILGGRKCLTEEQAAHLSSYMNLNQLEADFFLKLIQVERAGSDRLKRTYQRHLKDLRNAAHEIKSRVPPSQEMSEEDRALFYSSWQYGMIRILTSVEAYQTAPAIAKYLNLSISRVQEILSFLATRSLCKEGHGRYWRTEKNTHIEARSPLVARHHQNWRIKAAELLDRADSEDMAFTAPVSLAKNDLPKVRTILLAAITEISKIIETSTSECVVYLGIDWIRM